MEAGMERWKDRICRRREGKQERERETRGTPESTWTEYWCPLNIISIEASALQNVSDEFDSLSQRPRLLQVLSRSNTAVLYKWFRESIYVLVLNNTVLWRRKGNGFILIASLHHRDPQSSKHTIPQVYFSTFQLLNLTLAAYPAVGGGLIGRFRETGEAVRGGGAAQHSPFSLWNYNGPVSSLPLPRSSNTNYGPHVDKLIDSLRMGGVVKTFIWYSQTKSQHRN